MKEELRLVERFEELREGLRVLVIACSFCGRSHSGKLGPPTTVRGIWATGEIDDSGRVRFPVLPNPHVEFHVAWRVTERAVHGHRVFAFVQAAPLEATAQARKRMRARAE